MTRSSVYAAVQVAAEKAPGMKRRAVFAVIRMPVLGEDFTSAKRKGEWLPLGLRISAAATRPYDSVRPASTTRVPSNADS
jgi:fructose-1,6-bisphosphatase/inositol monophosphatase family enzyme